MISKVLSAHSFYHTCRYVCMKQGAEVLLAEGVRSHSYQLMAEDFIRQQGSRLSKKLSCFHGILSFYPGEKPSNERMIEIAQKYLQGLGLADTQYAICKHSDRAHLWIIRANCPLVFAANRSLLFTCNCPLLSEQTDTLGVVD